MNDTPKTNSQPYTADWMTGEPLVSRKFARKLERQNNALRKWLMAAIEGQEIKPESLERMKKECGL